MRTRRIYSSMLAAVGGTAPGVSDAAQHMVLDVAMQVDRAESRAAEAARRVAEGYLRFAEEFSRGSHHATTPVGCSSSFVRDAEEARTETRTKLEILHELVVATYGSDVLRRFQDTVRDDDAASSEAVAAVCMCGAIDPPTAIGDDGLERCAECGCH